jgi:hypothetical protein
MAREVGDTVILAHALDNVGAPRWRAGDPAGEALIAESLRLALGAGNTEEACRSYVNMIWIQVDELRLADAERNLADAMALA